MYGRPGRSSLMALTVEPQPVEAPDAGVIEEARRRQHRHRVVGAVALAGAIIAGVLALGFAGGSTTRRAAAPVRLASSLTSLTGPPLGSSDLRVVASGNA